MIPPFDSPYAITLAHLLSNQLSPAEVAQDQWPPLIELAVDHGVAGMLLWSLRQAGWVHTGDPTWEPLLEATRRNGRRSVLQEKARLVASGALDRAGIPVVWLKGIGLAYTCYPEPHLRPMDDLDVLVPSGQMQSAHQALLNSGFRGENIDFASLAGFADQARHHDCLFDRTGKVKLELHFNLLDPAHHERLSEDCQEWFWGQVEDLSASELPFRVLKLEANLLHLCAHIFLQHQEKPPDLLHLLDLHLLITRSVVNWDLVFEQSVELRWVSAVEQALRLLLALFVTPVPQEVIDRLQEYRPLEEGIQFDRSPQKNTPRWEEWHRAFSAMSIAQRVHLVWLTIFPPAIFLRHQYNLSAGQSLFPYYFLHFLDGGREAVRALIFTRKGTNDPS